MSKSRRSIEREEFWRLAIQEHRESGLSVRQFCQRKSLTETLFYSWRRRIEGP